MPGEFELERDFSHAGWLLQMFLAYFGPIIALGMLENMVEGTDTAAWDAVPYFVVPLLAVAVALAVSAVFPSSVIEGDFVWALPAAVELCIFVWTLCWQPSKAVHLFYVGPHQGEEGWLLALFTLPTWGCCWYSAAMYWRRKRRRSGAISSDQKPVNGT